MPHTSIPTPLVYSVKPEPLWAKIRFRRLRFLKPQKASSRNPKTSPVRLRVFQLRRNPKKAHFPAHPAANRSPHRRRKVNPLARKRTNRPSKTSRKMFSDKSRPHKGTGATWWCLIFLGVVGSNGAASPWRRANIDMPRKIPKHRRPEKTIDMLFIIRIFPIVLHRQRKSRLVFMAGWRGCRRGVARAAGAFGPPRLDLFIVYRIIASCRLEECGSGFCQRDCIRR